MSSDTNELVTKCDPCQRYHRSHAKERVEVSHASMFNIWPGHTLHMDFCKFKGVNYVFIVDRLTGYIQVERTPNQCTSSAILAVKHWASKFGFPYRMCCGFPEKCLKKSSDKLTELHLAEITFAINSHVSAEGSCSNNDWFLGRSVRTRVPNSVNPKLNTEELILQTDNKSWRSHQNQKQNKKQKTNIFPWG